MLQEDLELLLSSMLILFPRRVDNLLSHWESINILQLSLPCPTKKCLQPIYGYSLAVDFHPLQPYAIQASRGVKGKRKVPDIAWFENKQRWARREMLPGKPSWPDIGILQTGSKIDDADMIWYDAFPHVVNEGRKRGEKTEVHTVHPASHFSPLELLPLRTADDHFPSR